MDEQIDREFEQPLRELPALETPLFQEVAVVRQNTLFSRMLCLSIFLHLALTPLLYLPGKRTGGTPPSTIAVDLNTVPSLPPASPEAPKPQTEEIAPKPETPPVPEPLPTPPMPETQRLNDTVKEAVAGGREQPELLEQASLGLGLSLGYFSSLAEGRTLRDDIKQYYFTLLRKINEKWWLIGKGSIRTPRIPIITVVISRNGELLNRIIEQGSGDQEFDQKILQAVDAANPFPPLPPSYTDPYFTVPIRMVAPLNLLFPDSNEIKRH